MNYFVENTDPFNTEDPFKQDPFKTVSFADDPFAGDPFHVSGAFSVLNLVFVIKTTLILNQETEILYSQWHLTSLNWIRLVFSGRLWLVNSNALG